MDDDVGCLESVESLLEREGHSIVTATRGNEALDVARRLREGRQRLDLSILDFNMPDLTGLETFQRLELEMPGTPAIFISGNATAAMESMVRTAGARALVSKPLDAFLLRNMVREVVRDQGLGGSGVN
ncbi:MAG TPA: response regulator [Planctomycetota bacterium]|nr:response regulator [Planctomycetota bacterium]